MEWSKTVWESDLEEGLRLFHRAADTHVITSHFALPLMLRQPGGLVVEINDGTREYNAEHYRLVLLRSAQGHDRPRGLRAGA
jgi:hypothetical protein